LLILMMTRIFILGVVNSAFNWAGDLIKKIIINVARKKISKFSNLTVIGITGSYGKTTTKIFLDHILLKKFRVVSTPRHVNTEIGIAKFILRTDLSDFDIFIVEMGAYNVGEIKLICDMVGPKIGILTAISDQHLSLFGNIKKTQQAKYELLRALPPNGLAITNSDNEYCREFLSTLKCQVETFGAEREFQPTILITDLKDSLDGISCLVNFRGEFASVQTSLHGSHNIFNVLPCILVANYLGISKEEIKSATTNLPQTIKIFKYGNCDVVDDSYNSNPQGFSAILDFINNFPSDRKRIVITRGMLELGKMSDHEHEKIAGEISYIADEIVLITPDFLESIQRGLVEKYNIKLVTKFEPQELLTYVKSLKETNAVILLENRIPAVVMNELKERAS